MTRHERLLITGCQGYLGRRLMRAASCLPQAEVFGLDRNAAALPAPDDDDPTRANVRTFQGDLTHPGLSRLLADIQPDVIFHAAAAPRTASLAEQFQGTVLASEHLLRAVMETHVGCRVVVLGSAAEYGLHDDPRREDDLLAPQGDYGIAKAAQTHTALSFARRFDIPVVVGRIFNVYGASPPTLAVAALASQVARLELLSAQRQNRFSRGDAEPFRLQAQNLAARRDLIHGDDVVEALLALRRHGQAGRVYNIGSGEAVAIHTVAERLIALSTLAESAQQVLITPGAEPVAECSQAAIEAICHDTPWRPRVGLDEGLLRELHHWRQVTRKTARTASTRLEALGT